MYLYLTYLYLSIYLSKYTYLAAIILTPLSTSFIFSFTAISVNGVHTSFFILSYSDNAVIGIKRHEMHVIEFYLQKLKIRYKKIKFTRMNLK